MPVPSYPLPRPPAGADVHALPVEKVSQAILFSHLRTVELTEPAGTLIPVRLVPDLVTGGWLVRWEFGIIGSLPEEARARFPAIGGLHDARVEPQAWARVRINRERGLLDVAVELPSPDLVVPRNSLVEGAQVLPQGSRLPATLGGPERQLLGRVEGLDVVVDDEVVAQLEYVPLVEGPVGVRVFVIGGESFVDLGLGEARPVPVVPAWEPPAPPVDPAAPWAVTMDAVDVVDPNPTGPRAFALPVSGLD